LKSDRDGHKETYLEDRYFYVSLNWYSFVNKGKIFDSQVSLQDRRRSLYPARSAFYDSSSLQEPKAPWKKYGNH
jgi:hypothetical protein